MRKRRREWLHALATTVHRSRQWLVVPFGQQMFQVFGQFFSAVFLARLPDHWTFSREVKQWARPFAVHSYPFATFIDFRPALCVRKYASTHNNAINFNAKHGIDKKMQLFSNWTETKMRLAKPRSKMTHMFIHRFWIVLLFFAQLLLWILSRSRKKQKHIEYWERVDHY